VDPAAEHAGELAQRSASRPACSRVEAALSASEAWLMGGVMLWFHFSFMSIYHLID